MIWQYLAEIQLLCWKSWNLRVQKNLNMEKIAFKFVQIKFLAMHITYKKWSFDIFTVGYLLSTFMEHDLYLISNDSFGIKEKWIILTYAGIKFEMSSFCA